MKTIHHLKARWLMLAMLVAVVVGEVIAWQVSRAFDVRFEWIIAAALGIGVTAGITALIYDGNE